MFQNGRFFFKQLVNNVIDLAIGAIRLTQLEAVSGLTNPQLGGTTLASFDVKNGALVAAFSATGQRGVIITDPRSDDLFDFSYVVSKVLDTQSAQWMAVKLLSDYPTTANYARVYYRSSGFGSITGGWTLLNNEGDLSAILSANNVQFKVTFLQSTDPSATFAQIGGGYLITQPQSELSDNWTFSHPNSDANSPAKTAFRLIKAYASTVPTMFFRAYDDAGSLVASANTSANPTLFEYSTNNGTSWNALGVIPNTINTTEVRYNWASPPGVRVTVSLREA
jgi:hypothetical protein